MPGDGWAREHEEARDARDRPLPQHRSGHPIDCRCLRRDCDHAPTRDEL